MKYDELISKMPEEITTNSRFWSHYRKSLEKKIKKFSNENNFLTVIKARIETETNEIDKCNITKRMIDRMRIGNSVKRKLDQPQRKTSNGAIKGKMRSHKKELIGLMNKNNPTVVNKSNTLETFHDKHHINRVFSATTRNTRDITHVNNISDNNNTRQLSLNRSNNKTNGIIGQNAIIVKLNKKFSEYQPKSMKTFCVTEGNTSFRIAKMKHQITKLLLNETLTIN